MKNTPSVYSRHIIKTHYEMGFDANEYSRFKFGDKAIARKFGYDLADGFINEHLKLFPIDQQIVVASSPYCFIPTATFAMKDYFIQRLNAWLADNGFNPVQEIKVYRTITYTEDYGNLDAEQRMSLIGNDRFYMDFKFIEGKTVLFLDDVKITGAHEKMMRTMLATGGQQLVNTQMLFLYFAELDNEYIHPNIENHLNYHFVKSLLHLNKIIQNNDFLLNTRVVKYILCYEHEAFKNFIQYQRKKLVLNIYHSAIGNGYHKIEEYATNMRYIRSMLFPEKTAAPVTI